MANTRDFIVKNAVEVGGPTKVTVGDAATGGSRVSGFADVSTWAYDSKSYDTTSQSTNYLYDVLFKSDGTKMYTLNAASSIYQYSLSTAWDVSTASYDNKSFDLSSQGGGGGTGGSFNSNGTKFYKTAGGVVYEYSLSTAWDVSTASYNSVSLSMSAQDTNPTGMTFNGSGTKMYVVGGQNDRVYQYSLSTAYDLSTASYDSVFFSVQTQSLSPESVVFNNDGTKMFISCNFTDAVYQYDLTTAYDISTASYNTKTFSVASQAAAPYGMRFSADGDKMYIASAVDVTIYQYSTGSTVTTGSFDLSTGNYFTDTPSADVEYTFSNAGDVQSFQLEVTGAVKGYELSGAAYDSVSFSVSSQSTVPQGLSFSYDGSKMYVIDNSNRDIFQYSLSTSWDVSSASYDSVFFDVGTQDTGPFGMFFKTDGTKLYVCGGAGNDINEYSLSTAWDLSSISFVTNFSVSGQTGDPNDIYFTNDGTKFYVNGGNNDVYQYSCSTAWDVSTASYDSKSFSSASQTSQLEGLWLKSDGSKMFLLDRGNLSVFQYSLSTAYDVSTASYDSVSFSISSQDSNPQGIYFKPDGDKFYFVGATNDNVFQYSSGSAYTITWDADIAWPSGTAPDSPAAGEKDIYTFTTDDGGTTYIGVQSGDAFS